MLILLWHKRKIQGIKKARGTNVQKYFFSHSALSKHFTINNYLWSFFFIQSWYCHGENGFVFQIVIYKIYLYPLFLSPPKLQTPPKKSRLQTCSLLAVRWQLYLCHGAVLWNIYSANFKRPATRAALETPQWNPDCDILNSETDDDLRQMKSN